MLAFRQDYVVDLDVHLGNLEARQVLYALYYPLADCLGHLRDRTPVFHVNRYIRRRLPLADVYGEPAGAAGTASDVVHELPDSWRRITRQAYASVGRRDALYLLGRP